MALDLRDIGEGDKLLREAGGSAHTVLANYGTYAVISDFRHITNPSEWDMDGERIGDLTVGSAVRHKLTQESYIVTSLHDDCAVAVHTEQISDLEDWRLVGKAQFVFDT